MKLDNWLQSTRLTIESAREHQERERRNVFIKGFAFGAGGILLLLLVSACAAPREPCAELRCIQREAAEDRYDRCIDWFIQQEETLPRRQIIFKCGGRHECCDDVYRRALRRN